MFSFSSDRGFIKLPKNLILNTLRQITSPKKVNMPSLYGAVKSKTGELLQDSMEYCKGALQSVSRSFALTIPLVEENILGPIMVGYLEARILDTF